MEPYRLVHSWWTRHMPSVVACILAYLWFGLWSSWFGRKTLSFQPSRPRLEDVWSNTWWGAELVYGPNSGLAPKLGRRYAGGRPSLPLHTGWFHTFHESTCACSLPRPCRPNPQSQLGATSFHAGIHCWVRSPWSRRCWFDGSHHERMGDEWRA